MNIERYVTAVGLLVVACSVVAQTGPDVIRLSTAAYSALESLNGALDTTLQAQDALIAFEQGKTPRTPANHWSDLADRYRKAIKAVRAAPLPTSFDPSPYAFTATQLSNCATREASLQKARGYLSELKAAKQKANGEIAKMDEEIARAQRANQALTYLIEKHVTLAALPTFGSVFALDYLTLETEVQPALIDLDTTLKEHRKKLVGESRRLSVATSNLQSNLGVLEKLNCVTLAGRWVGTHRQTLTCAAKGTCVTEEALVDCRRVNVSDGFII